ncbi:hypothetical protein AKJ66_01955 [candidate division MSBL1 archaeon SCGC-AAA259E22]|uniref:Tyr recombinase domain-containing protein n=1 Tax=candidate division MSBL1 archaeon SCGC-AAA259E22 TaxID=1698265 RepID=A0A133UH03_9EURY|nr:hypothetical protein AKJ66_01955 [candidate division MSBL1 archaeon SCGC-AAA259E22]
MNLEKYDEFTSWIKGKSDETKRKYRSILRDYCEFTGMNPEELIDEAEEDWNSSRRSRGKVKDRIKSFQEHLEEQYSMVTVRNKLFWLKSFYSDNNFPQDDVSIPRASPTNRAMKIRSDEIRKLVDHAPSLRDKTIILMMFQSGMDVSTICSLNYGHVARGLKNDEYPLPIRVKRPKERVNYVTFIAEDGIEALKAYFDHRKNRPVEWDEKNMPVEREGEPNWDDPLFTKEKKGKGRIRPTLIQKMMRKLAVESGLVSREEMENSKMNPCRPHALRKAFSSILEINGINSNIIDGFLGHSVDYDSAYSQQTEEELAKAYLEAEEDLRISEKKGIEEYDEKLDAFGKTIEELVQEKKRLEEEITELKEKYERIEERREESDEIMNRLFQDEEFREFVKEKLKEL